MRTRATSAKVSCNCVDQPPDPQGDNGAGDGYAAYADGDLEDLFAFAGPHAYADEIIPPTGGFVPRIYSSRTEWPSRLYEGEIP